MIHTINRINDGAALDAEARDAWRRMAFLRWAEVVVALLDMDDERGGHWCAVAIEWLVNGAARDRDRASARRLANSFGVAVNQVADRRRTLERVAVIVERWATLTHLAHAKTSVWWGIAARGSERASLASAWRQAWAAGGWISQTSHTLRYRQSPVISTGPYHFPTGARLEIILPLGGHPRARWQHTAHEITHADRIPALPLVVS